MKGENKTIYILSSNLPKLQEIKKKKDKFSLSSEVNKVIEKLYETVK